MTFVIRAFASSDDDTSNSCATSRGSYTPPLPSDNSSSDEIDEVSSPFPSLKFEEIKGQHQEHGGILGIAACAKSTDDYIDQIIRNGEEKNSFVVTNLANVKAQFALWERELPMVEPFYAIKCYPNSQVIECLASLGCGFDCASMGEIHDVCTVLKSTQGQREKIVYAQPAKMEEHLHFALRNGVALMVFDGEDELFKIASALEAQTQKWHKAENGQQISSSTQIKPEAQLLLRVATSDSQSVCQFSNKFGCDAKLDGPHLLEVAHRLGLNVVGVSFHVGSGCGNADAYAHAIADAEFLFLCAKRLRTSQMTVLDIGGGFPGDPSAYYNDGKMPSFEELAATIRCSVAAFERRLAEVSSKWVAQLRYIAEPGRFFVSASTTVATRVYSRKTTHQQQAQALYVDDGVYGTFNNIVYDHYRPVKPRLLRMHQKLYSKYSQDRIKARDGPAADDGGEGDDDASAADKDEEEEMPTAIFGPTCDGLDQLCDANSCDMHRTEVGDWLLWSCMGAYTHTASFVFNGYDHVPNTHVVDIQELP